MLRQRQSDEEKAQKKQRFEDSTFVWREVSKALQGTVGLVAVAQLALNVLANLALKYEGDEQQENGAGEDTPIPFRTVWNSASAYEDIEAVRRQLMMMIDRVS